VIEAAGVRLGVRPRDVAAAAMAFTLLLAVMVFHESEHFAQVAQKDLIGSTCPNDCRGLLGFTFDVEWVHFAYNGSVLLALAAMWAWLRTWERRGAGAIVLTATVLFQGYHFVEHTEKLAQWYRNGRVSPQPGLLGQHFSLVELHFVLNTAVTLGALIAYWELGLHRQLTRRHVTVAGALLAVGAVALFGVWTQRPPTTHLAAGVHQGPIVIDEASRLVGEPGTVVVGGIRVTHGDVIVRNIEVRGAATGIEVRSARGVLLQNVTVRGATLDGINARDASVIVRKCDVQVQGRYAQGIDISFAAARGPSMVKGCRVHGGQEGIVAHTATVAITGNTVSGTSMRGIAMTEMSMGPIEDNVVQSPLGVGIYCGDWSHCHVQDNVAQSLVSNYYATAELGTNRFAGVRATLHATVERH
jgi:hypothetical protein